MDFADGCPSTVVQKFCGIISRWSVLYYRFEKEMEKPAVSSGVSSDECLEMTENGSDAQRVVTEYLEEFVGVLDEFDGVRGKTRGEWVLADGVGIELVCFVGRCLEVVRFRNDWLVSQSWKFDRVVMGLLLDRSSRIEFLMRCLWVRCRAMVRMDVVRNDSDGDDFLLAREDRLRAGGGSIWFGDREKDELLGLLDIGKWKEIQIEKGWNQLVVLRF